VASIKTCVIYASEHVRPIIVVSRSKHLSKVDDCEGEKLSLEPVAFVEMSSMKFLVVFVFLAALECSIGGSNQKVASLKLDDTNFIEVLKGTPVVFVKFYTSW
jgi:hypothetical protein